MWNSGKVRRARKKEQVIGFSIYIPIVWKNALNDV